MSDDVRNHPDYARGYERAFSQEPPEPQASAEYRIGYEAAQRFVDALTDVGMKAETPGNYSLSMTLGPMNQIGFDLEDKGC